jgi:hypothetical protein
VMVVSIALQRHTICLYQMLRRIAFHPVRKKGLRRIGSGRNFRIKLVRRAGHMNTGHRRGF